MLYLLDPAGTTLDGLVEYVPGFLVSFPRIEGARGIEYVIPRRYWAQETG